MSPYTETPSLGVAEVDLGTGHPLTPFCWLPANQRKEGVTPRVCVVSGGADETIR